MIQESTYLAEYNEFMDSLKKGVTTGEDAGICVAKFAQHFAAANNELAVALYIFNKKAAEVEGTIDDNGKAISSTKAKTIYEASQEYKDYLDKKTALQNIEQIINAVKSMQKGLLQEFSHVGNM